MGGGGRNNLFLYPLAKQVFNRLNHQVLYFTCMAVDFEDTVNPGILPHKTALTMSSAEDNTKVLLFLLFDIFFKVKFLNHFLRAPGGNPCLREENPHVFFPFPEFTRIPENNRKGVATYTVCFHKFK